MKLLIALAFVMASFGVYAGPFKITISSIAGNAAEQAAINAAILQLENNINNSLPEADSSNYLKGMANSSVFAGKGVGVDYANDIDIFVIGAGVGVGVDVGNNSFSDLMGGDVDAEQFRGFGVAPGLMGGINAGILPWDKIGPVELDRLKLYFNFLPFKKDDADFSIDSTTIGIHAQYKLIKEKEFLPGGIARWGGVDVSSGFEFNKLEIIVRNTQNVTEAVNQGGNTANATFNGTATVGAKTSTKSIPFEASTSFQLLNVITLFGGLGADINFGKAEAIANVDGPFSLTASGGGSATGTGAVDLGSEGKPASFLARGFAGIQFNILLAHIYVQINKSFGKNLVGANLGLRLSW